jgi:uncharacterized Fe-S cluster-containing protein
MVLIQVLGLDGDKEETEEILMEHSELKEPVERISKTIYMQMGMVVVVVEIRGQEAVEAEVMERQVKMVEMVGAKVD